MISFQYSAPSFINAPPPPKTVPEDLLLELVAANLFPRSAWTPERHGLFLINKARLDPARGASLGTMVSATGIVDCY